jgi:hypothetical protein
MNVFLNKIVKTQLREGFGKTSMARRSRVASLTMKGQEPALSLPKERRKQNTAN